MNKRILAFMIDFIISALILAIVGSLSIFNIEGALFGKVYGIVLIISVFGICFKDIFFGRSIGKRIMKIRVVGFNGKTPNIFKLIIRNITFCIWPIEALLYLLGKTRIGDKLASTNVVPQESH